jgi:HK97 family phage major capsid protein
MKTQQKLQALRLERDTAATALRQHIDSKAGKAWTAEDSAKYDAGLANLDRIDGELDLIERQLRVDGGGQARQNVAASGAGAPDSYVFRDQATGRPLQSLSAATMRPGSAQLSSVGLSLPGEGRDAGLADMLRGVAGLRHNSEGVQQALSVGTDASGGFTVPASVLRGVLSALVPSSSLLQAGAQVILLEDEQAKQFRIARVATVPTAAWRNESALIAESDPTFNSLDLTPRSLAVMFKVSRELLMDGVNIDSVLTEVLARSIARELDRVGLRGTGTAPQPRGILNTVGIQAVTNGANGASLATLRWANLLTAYQSIAAADAPRPSAVIAHPRTVVGFGQLADTTNQPLRLPQLLETMRMVTTSLIPVNLTVGTSTDCTEAYVGDFSQFGFFMREQLGIAVLRERFADTGEIGFVAHVRVDVACMYPQAFALVTGIRP